MLEALGPRPTAARALLAAYDAWIDAADPAPAMRATVLAALRRALIETGRGAAETLDSVAVLLSRRARIRDAAALRLCEALPPCAFGELRV